MEVKIHTVKFEADANLLDFVQERVDKLEVFSDNIISSEVFLRMDNAANPEDKIAEIKIAVPGADLFAKKQCKSFEEAIDTAVDALRRQIKKRKQKRILKNRTTY